MTHWKKLAVMTMVAVVVLMACAPAAQPTPVPPLAKQAPAVAPTAVPKQAAPTAVAKPVESAKPAAKPAAQAPAPTPAPKAEPGWKVEWDKALSAAKKEGKVVVSGPPGDTWRKAVADFGKAYPEIRVDWSGAPDRDQVPKIVAEQKAGLYNWDLHMGGSSMATGVAVTGGALAPLRPTFLLPDVLQDATWVGGFRDGWTDTEEKYHYAFLGYLSPTALVNREVAPEAQLKTIDDLLDPQWKGKIAWDDPLVGGPGQQKLVHLLVVKGEAWLRKLLAQDIAVLKDSRMLMEHVIRGRYVAIVGRRSGDYEHFKRLGLADHLKIIEPDSTVGQGITHGSGGITLLNRAPNPNAAKVFVNWLLSKPGQEAFVRETGNNSRRLDVAGPEETQAKPGIKYIDISIQKYEDVRQAAIKVAKEFIK